MRKTKGIVMPIASLAERLIPDVPGCEESGATAVGEGMVGLVPGLILLVVVIAVVVVLAEAKS
jgi:hypothetical protein